MLKKIWKKPVVVYWLTAWVDFLLGGYLKKLIPLGHPEAISAVTTVSGFISENISAISEFTDFDPKNIFPIPAFADLDHLLFSCQGAKAQKKYQIHYWRGCLKSIR
jgi:hypothetical protein